MRIDHLLLGCRKLDDGIGFVESLTGVRPQHGGRHPSAGTHNALLSLGPGCYLEVIAPEPGAGPLAPWARFLEDVAAPRLATWAAAVDDVARLADRARTAGLGVSGPNPGSRARPDGSTLAWRTLFVDAGAGLVAPFFIEWATGSVHPSVDAPAGCALLSLDMEHPDPKRVGETFAALGIGVKPIEGPVARLRARLDTPSGPVDLD